jgi:hypothetical protein
MSRQFSLPPSMGAAEGQQTGGLRHWLVQEPDCAPERPAPGTIRRPQLARSSRSAARQGGRRQCRAIASNTSTAQSEAQGRRRQSSPNEPRDRRVAAQPPGAENGFLEAPFALDAERGRPTPPTRLPQLVLGRPGRPSYESGVIRGSMSALQKGSGPRQRPWRGF